MFLHDLPAPERVPRGLWSSHAHKQLCKGNFIEILTLPWALLVKILLGSSLGCHIWALLYTADQRARMEKGKLEYFGTKRTNAGNGLKRRDCATCRTSIVCDTVLGQGRHMALHRELEQPLGPSVLPLLVYRGPISSFLNISFHQRPSDNTIMCFSFSLNIYLSVLPSLRRHTRLLVMSRLCSGEGKSTVHLHSTL